MKEKEKKVGEVGGEEKGKMEEEKEGDEEEERRSWNIPAACRSASKYH